MLKVNSYMERYCTIGGLARVYGILSGVVEMYAVEMYLNIMCYWYLYMSKA